MLAKASIQSGFSAQMLNFRQGRQTGRKAPKGNKNMHKFVMLVLAGTALALAVPQAASAAPLSGLDGLKAAAETVIPATNVHYRYWRPYHWGYRHWGYRHHHWGWRY